jgi:hypothetical protein
MKTTTTFLVAVLALSTPLLKAAESERTAEHILTTPSEHEGKEVALDVAFVKPVHWKSPVEELAFFHAVTMDRKDMKPGGGILVAIPAADAASFAKKYGTDYEGRYEKDELTGTLMAGPGCGPRKQVWFVDTSGQAAAMIEQKKLSLEDDGRPDPAEQGQGRGPRERRKDRGGNPGAGAPPAGD